MTEMAKTKVKMSKPVYLGFSVLDQRKLEINQFYYDCIEEYYREKNKIILHRYCQLFYINKYRRLFNDLKDDVQKLSDNSIYEVDPQLPIGKNEKRFRYDEG